MAGNDTNTVFYLSMDGADGDSSFSDESVGGAGHSVASVNVARRSDDQAKFGATSLYLDGGDAHLIARRNTGWNFRTSDFTLDFWAYVLTPVQGDLVCWYADDDNFLSIERVSYTGAAIIYRARCRRAGVDQFTLTMGSAVTMVGGWHHVALERAGTDVRLYIDGTVVASTTVAATQSVVNQLPLYIGKSTRPGVEGLFWMHGYIDALRVSNVARYDGAFTPAAYPYAATATISGRGQYRSRKTVSVGGRGTYGVTAHRYTLAGRGTFKVIRTYDANGRGTFMIRRAGVTVKGRGSYNVAIQRSIVRGRSLYHIKQATTINGRGTYWTKEGATTVGGRGTHMVRQASTVKGRGAYRSKFPATINGRGMFNIEQTTLDKYELYYKVGSEPDPAVDAVHSTYSSLPISGFAMDQTEGLHYFLLRRRNKFGLESKNITTMVIELDGSYSPINVRPTAPVKLEVSPGEDGTVDVYAEYIPGSDGSLKADVWHIYVTDDGSDPDPDVDTPTEVDIVNVNGVAVLQWTSEEFSNGSTIKVIVRVARTEIDSRDDGNSTIVSTTASTTGPPTPAPSGKLLTQGGNPAST